MRILGVLGVMAQTSRWARRRWQWYVLGDARQCFKFLRHIVRRSPSLSSPLGLLSHKVLWLIKSRVPCSHRRDNWHMSRCVDKHTCDPQPNQFRSFSSRCFCCWAPVLATAFSVGQCVTSLVDLTPSLTFPLKTDPLPSLLSLS